MKFTKVMREKWRHLPVTIRSSVCFSVAMFLQKGLQSLSTPIFTRIMTTIEYEQYTVYYAWSSILVIVATLQLASGVLNNQLVKGEYPRFRIVSSLQGLSSIWALVFFALCSVLFALGIRFNSMPISLWCLMLFSFIFSSSVDLWTVSKRFYYEYREPCLVMISIAAASFIVPLLCVINSDDKGNARIFAVLAVNICAGVIFWIINMVHGRQFYAKPIWSVALRFNLPLVPHFLSLSILNQIDKIMIEGLCAPGKAAIYSVAHTIAAMIQLLMTAINYSLVPWTYQKLKDGECAEVARKTNLILLAVAAVLCILMLLAPEVMWVMAPAEYQEAIYVIPSMSAGIFFNYLYQLYSRVELYHEKTKLMMYGSISCAVLNLFLNYAFIKAYGYMAAAYTTLFCYIYMSIIHGVMAHKITQEHQYTVRPYNTRGILSISGVVMLVSLGIPFLYRYTYVRLGMILAVAIAMALNGKKVVRLTQYILNK